MAPKVLTLDDIFRTNILDFHTHIPEVNTYSSSFDWHAKSVRLTYARGFGNNKLRSVSVKLGSEEERNRVQ